jgi:hypothetical protein
LNPSHVSRCPILAPENGRARRAVAIAFRSELNWDSVLAAFGFDLGGSHPGRPQIGWFDNLIICFIPGARRMGNVATPDLGIQVVSGPSAPCGVLVCPSPAEALPISRWTHLLLDHARSPTSVQSASPAFLHAFIAHVTRGGVSLLGNHKSADADVQASAAPHEAKGGGLLDDRVKHQEVASVVLARPFETCARSSARQKEEPQWRSNSETPG